MTPEEQALFNAGERRGIERAIEKLRDYDSDGGRSVPNAIGRLESLRDAPAGEQTHGPLRKGDAFMRMVEAAGPLETTLLAGSPAPAKPEAAPVGEQSAE